MPAHAPHRRSRHVGDVTSYRPRGTTRVEAVRAYDTAAASGTRLLVDRLWPRGLAKADAAFDEWLKDVAPSTELRQWYAHDLDRYDEFVRRYRAELRHEPAKQAVDHVVALCKKGHVQLVTATRDLEHSGARVLADHVVELL